MSWDFFFFLIYGKISCRFFKREDSNDSSLSLCLLAFTMLLIHQSYDIVKYLYRLVCEFYSATANKQTGSCSKVLSKQNTSVSRLMYVSSDSEQEINLAFSLQHF